MRDTKISIYGKLSFHVAAAGCGSWHMPCDINTARGKPGCEIS